MLEYVLLIKRYLASTSLVVQFIHAYNWGENVILEIHKQRGIGGIMKKSTWIPVLLSFGTMILLYLIGYIFDLSIFKFKYSLNGNAEIALLPIAIGLVVVIVVDRMVKSRI